MSEETGSLSSTCSASSISILPDSLYLTCIPFDRFESCLPIILRILFDTYSGSRLFSFTRRDEDISLLLDAHTKSYFPDNILLGAPGEWRAIRINEGPEMLDVTGIVHSLASPLQKAHIDQMYLSTFSSDIILVAQDHLDTAVKTISSNLDYLLNSKTSFNNNLSNLKIDTSTPTNRPVPEISPSHRCNTSLSTSSLSSQNDISMSLSRVKASLIILTFSKKNLQHFAFGLIKTLLQINVPNTFVAEETFFSYTENDDEITIIVNSHFAAFFQLSNESSIVTIHSQSWQAIDVCAGEFTSEPVALVVPMSAVLADENISIYYLTTYNSELTLVWAQTINKAITALKQKLHVIE